MTRSVRRWVRKSTGCAAIQRLEVDDIINQFSWMTVVVFGRYQEIGQSAEQSDVRRRVYELLQQRRSWWLPGAAKMTPETEHHVPIVYRIRIEQMTGRHTSRRPGDRWSIARRAPQLKVWLNAPSASTPGIFPGRTRQIPHLLRPQHHEKSIPPGL